MKKSKLTFSKLLEYTLCLNYIIINVTSTIKSICTQETAPLNRHEKKLAGKCLKQENTQRWDDKGICVQLAVYYNCPSCQVGQSETKDPLRTPFSLA